MEKDEKILKKIGKLLTMYGVNEEEKNKFLADMEDAKYDDQEELEENQEETETPVEEEQVEEQPKENEELPMEEETETESPMEEEVEPTDEVPMEEQPMEQPVEEQEPVFDPKQVYEEQQKTIEGLTSRLQALEDIVSKLGVEQPKDQTLGASAQGNAIDEGRNDAFEEINRKRVG